jgi:hypothetical protein
MLVVKPEAQAPGVKVDKPIDVFDLVADTPKAENERLAFRCLCISVPTGEVYSLEPLVVWTPLS